ncbi:hypothetical protein LOZ53_003463 [Ophidiomyces ophidiicola]|nr:hypothetical protein LOZ55_005994 [Ophidiomyces ophidiicola]KAI1983897.1 hypothetical protein LOZ54_004739 [Ophidiomyces ophidiicola]KAI1989897.1 hypothetical protein LOZ53_003463 [Ophidiomyces ophidiicola]KAI2001106.1 hypothetical protein LOZ51_001398 [Ophidiomyces ophidiicola]
MREISTTSQDKNFKQSPLQYSEATVGCQQTQPNSFSGLTSILTNANLHGRAKEESHLSQKTDVCTAVDEKKECHVIRILKADFERRIQAIRKERDWHEAEAKQWREAAQEAVYEIVGLEDHCHLLQKNKPLSQVQKDLP